MENKVIQQRIQALRNRMAHEKIDFYLVPTADFHNSEYVSDYFKVREYLSGFTGSNGTLLVSDEDACLWTDGRYFTQAKKELEGTGIRLMRMQEEGVPDVPDYLFERMLDGQVLGFDGRVVDAAFGKKLEQRLTGRRVGFAYRKDLTAALWKERPPFPCSAGEAIPEAYSGMSAAKKLSLVREAMRKEGGSCLFIEKLDDLMWLLNLRGDDVACNPVLLSYGFFTEREAFLFLQEGALNQGVVDSMREAGVQIRDYRMVFSFLQNYLFQGQERQRRGTLLYDGRHVSYAFYCMFRSYGNCRETENPTERLKAVKNETEIAMLRDIFLKDSVAVTKFIYWLKHTGEPQTEYSAAEKLDGFRREIPEFLDLSFPTISAYRENAAMMHYHVSREHAAAVGDYGMLLIDSGGQYLGGTTDVTRTVAVGKVPEEMKAHFTAVVVGMLRLAGAKFLYGCSGRNLDILARGPIWELGMDYKCGTGHGIGYMLNVHEGPQNIRWRFSPDQKEAVLEEGMLVTDEPGIYLDGKYGIRIENVLLVKKGVKNGDGQFMEFETLTYVPIERAAVLPERMPEKERRALNAYHREVYERVSPFLTKDERAWLREETAEI